MVELLSHRSGKGAVVISLLSVGVEVVKRFLMEHHEALTLTLLDDELHLFVVLVLIGHLDLLFVTINLLL